MQPQPSSTPNRPLRRAVAALIGAVLAFHALPAVAQTVNPDLWVTDGWVNAVALEGNTLYVGGNFTAVGPPGATPTTARANLAAFNLTTGLPTSWNPGANAQVLSLAVSSGIVYAGGDFTNAGGQPRTRIAAIDGTGTATLWNPGASGAVRALVLGNGVVYAGGLFTTIGGTARNYLAALDAVTGAATAFNPSPNNSVRGLALGQGTLYVVGDFTALGPFSRSRIVAVDIGSGTPTPWNPSANNQVHAVAVAGSTVYVGGAFSQIGSTPRNHLAAFDVSSATPLPWNPGTDATVRALAVGGSKVFAGGFFSTIAGVSRSYVAAVDAMTGALTDWDIQADATVYALATAGNTVCVGGTFVNIRSQSRKSVAVAATDVVGVPRGSANAPRTCRIEASRPHPLRSAGSVRFAIDVAGAVTLELFDLQGRRKRTVIASEWLDVGVYETRLDRAGLASGIYWLRLDAGRGADMRKLVIE